MEMTLLNWHPLISEHRTRDDGGARSRWTPRRYIRSDSAIDHVLCNNAAASDAERETREIDATEQIKTPATGNPF